MKNIDIVTKGWSDYEILDSGNNRKLERFGSYIVIRPETQALWKPDCPDEWKRAQAEFRFKNGKGAWQKKNIPESWELSWRDIRFLIRLTSFKHTGVFPEQAANWEWLIEKIGEHNQPNILNLFGYTGIASTVAAKCGARVTHVDASKQSNAWAKGNARLSEVPESEIRFLLDDALKFVEREARRGTAYDGILLDPPAFGRGPKGEMWHIEESLPRLLDGVKKILSNKPGSFFLLNGYAAGYSPLSLVQLAADSFGNEKLEFGELRLAESEGERMIPSGIYVRFVR